MEEDRKYWVPALEKAHAVIRLIGAEPGRYRLSDLCKTLEISKSSMFSLLNTMDELGWITRDQKETYSLGLHYGLMGNAFFERYDIVHLFHHEASKTLQRINESIQLARLEGNEVFYLAKETSASLVQMISSPGARLPAHATGLGKALLAQLSDQDIYSLFPNEQLPQLTVNTIATRTRLLEELDVIRGRGYAYDMQEGVMGFNCVAIAIVIQNGQLAAVSTSVPIHAWTEKRETMISEIQELATRLTLNEGSDMR